VTVSLSVKRRAIEWLGANTLVQLLLHKLQFLPGWHAQTRLRPSEPLWKETRHDSSCVRDAFAIPAKPDDQFSKSKGTVFSSTPSKSRRPRKCTVMQQHTVTRSCAKGGFGLASGMHQD
jgi:hypothetical protein